MGKIIKIKIDYLPKGLYLATSGEYGNKIFFV